MKIFSKAVFCFLLLAGIAYSGEVTIKQALLAAFKDDAVKSQQDNAAVLKKDSYSGIPLIDDIELRLRNDAFDINRLRASLRVKPRGFGETRAARRYNNLFAQSNDRRQQMMINQALRNRYIEILEHMEQRTIDKLYKELIVVYEDRITVMEKKKYNVDEFDLNNLIEDEDKNTKFHNELFELKRVYFPWRNNLEKSLDKKDIGDIDTAGFVDVDSVIALVEGRTYTFDTNNVYLDYYRLRLQQVGVRYDLEKAETRQYVSFLDFSFDNGEIYDETARKNEGKDYNLYKAYSLELGLRIPDLTIARHDLARRKVDYLSEKEDFEALKRELEIQMEKDQQDLRSFIAQYRFLKARENEVNATSSLKKYLQMKGVDPLLLLSIKESIIKNHIEIAKLQYSILRNYIQVLDVAGELCRPPLKNYLSRSLEVLE